MKLHGIIVSVMILIPLSVTYAYWPMSVEENLLVSPGPDTSGWNCQALPYPNNSTLVVYKQGWTGMVYQIIDQYGQFKYPSSVELAPESGFGLMYGPHLISDGCGGAIVCWNLAAVPQAIYAQRIDSLGNLMWNNAGITIFPFNEADYDISPDGEGGFLIAIAIDEVGGDNLDVFAQRVDSEGNLLWGEDGTLVSGLLNIGQRYPVITHDGQGGCFVVWEDHRPPYSYWGALYAQHLDGEGNILWPEDMLITGEEEWGHCVIPDGEGGFILQSNPGPADFNTHWRIDGDGNVLWERDHLSWLFWSEMVAGEPGFFYLGFAYDSGTYAQRVDIDGNNYWPTWGSGQPGMLMANYEGWQHNSHERFTYVHSKFYGIFDYNVNFEYPKVFVCQALDTLGNRLLGDNGIFMSTLHEGNFQHSNISVTLDGGIILVYEESYEHDVYAKRCNADGTLGGPLPPVEDVTISISGNDIVLTWTAVEDSAEYYIYKSGQPYAFPSEPHATVTDTVYTDVNGILQDFCFFNVRWLLSGH